MSIQVGTLVPLRLQMRDENTGVNVSAEILNPLNENIATIPLEHIKDGLYYSNSYIMPDLSFVLVRYLTDSEEYEVVIERIDSEPAPTEEKSWLIGYKTETIKVNDYKIGILRGI